MLIPRCFFVICLMLVPSAAMAQQKAVDETIQRAIPFIESQGQKWIEEKKCVSCHQVPFGIWSLRLAQQSGFSLDAEQLEKQVQWAISFSDKNKNTKSMERDGGGLDTIYQLLLSGNVDSNKPVARSLTNLLVSMQEDDGSFKPAGQLPLQRRPVRETTYVSTMWAALALDDFDAERFKESIDKAILFGTSDYEGKSTEWLAVRSLIAQRWQKKQSATFIKKLLAAQNEDGGWGWIRGAASDAFGTGVALYALAQSSEEHAAVIERGQAYLVSSQNKKGHWAVPSTKKNRQGKQAPTADYWGSCWAVLGLLVNR